MPNLPEIRTVLLNKYGSCYKRAFVCLINKDNLYLTNELRTQKRMKLSYFTPVLSLFTMFSLCSFLLVQGCSDDKKDVCLNVMTFNIRMDTPADSLNSWSYRKDFAANIVKFHNVDIVGTQEVLHNQLTDMLSSLPKYNYVGVGREDGKTKGEYSAILYRKDKFMVVESGDFWLAEDVKAVGEKGWDAACERIATWAVFEEKESRKRFFMLNTHFDHIGQVARRESAMLILKKANELSEGLPIIVTGDFNAVPGDEPIKIITDTKNEFYLTDSRSVAALRYGPDFSFHNFGRMPVEERSLIDYIFVKGDIKVLKNGVITDTEGCKYPSDHNPVMATVSF
jgi:Metal-dependent hydrolase